MDKFNGLTQKQASEALSKYGPNLLPQEPPPSSLKIFASQLKSPLVYVLLGASLVTFALGEIADTVLILVAVLINTILGFIQEKRANNALYALRQLVHPKAKVVRDGKQMYIQGEEVAVGDLVIVGQGDKIPADGKILYANRFSVNEAILTGESRAVVKKEGDMVCMGTIVVGGKARFVVEKTGGESEIGKIATSIQSYGEDTPLKRQLGVFSKQLSLLIAMLVGVVFVFGLVSGKGFVEILITSVALAVSSIPEGLLVSLTVVLAIGMQRVLKHKGLVRSLLSAETLGGVTTICIDKTGTLTQGEMQVVDSLGNLEKLKTQVLLANDRDEAMVIAAYNWGKSLKSSSEILLKHEVVDSITFSPQKKYFASLNNWGKKNMLFVNGAAEVLLKKAKLTASEKKEILSNIDSLTGEGKRVIAFIRKQVGKDAQKIDEKDLKSGFEWVGIISFSDPVRDGVAQAIEKTKKAGIKTIVITGDYPKTAISVMRSLKLELDEKKIILGKDLEEISETQLKQKINEGTTLFARTTPHQKLKIIKVLKAKGEVVAMMGDGVNDAPALKIADIGIVVGEATDVAKESADLVLLDSSFATIVEAIEEGRGIFDNIRKIVLYLLSDGFEEIIAVLGSLALRLPLPVTAAQILWINLVSDGFPNLALTIDPKRTSIMQQPPRPADEKIITNWMKLLIAITSFIGGVVALILFIYYYKTTGDEILARSVAFISLGANSLVFVFTVRTLTEPFWKSNPLSNKWLNLAVAVGLVLQFTPFISSTLQNFFELKFPGAGAIIVVFMASMLTFIMIEVVKGFVRKKVQWFQH